MKKYSMPVIGLSLGLALAGCAAQSSVSTIGMANPASVYCVEKGGTLILKENKGYCQLSDRVVEEWEFYRENNAA